MRYFIIFFLVLGLLVSCDEAFFEQELFPATQLTDPIQSTEDLERIVAGTYWSMIGGSESAFSNPVDLEQAWLALASDAFMITSPPSPRYTTQDMTYFYYERDADVVRTGQSVLGGWQLMYSLISNVNYGIEIIEEAAPAPPFEDDNSSKTPAIASELYFLRAWNYWMLANMFAPPYVHGGSNEALALPMKLRNSQGLEDASVAPSTVAEMYEIILADLDRAIENLAPNIRVGRASRAAAEGLKMRVLLAMGEWAEAEAMATTLIEGYSFRLEENPVDIYNKVLQERSSEVIFEWQNSSGHQFIDQPNKNGYNTPIRVSLYNWIERRTFGQGTSQFGGLGAEGISYRSMPVSHSVLQQVGWMDGNLNETEVARNDKRYQQVYHRAEAGTDTRLEGYADAAVNTPYVWVFKDCRTDVDTAYDGSLNNDLYRARNHMNVIRLGEVYLTRAVCRARLGDLSGAVADLNVIRERAWGSDAEPFVPASVGDFAGASDLEAAIEIERLKELTGEGDRLYYLRAMNQEVPARERGGSALPFDDILLYNPFPIEEIDLNGEIDE